MNSKKGLSQVVSVMVLVLLTIVIIGIVWTTINTFVLKKLDNAGSCYGIQGKVNLDNDWTCYNSTGKEFHFSINVGEIDLNAILISVVNNDRTSSEVRKIYNESSIVKNVTYLGDSSYNISLPKRESGKTYILQNVTLMPDEISIAPVVSGSQCDITDKIENIYLC